MTSKTISRFLLPALMLAGVLSVYAGAPDLYVGSNSSGVSSNFTTSNSFSAGYVGYQGSSNTLTVTTTNGILNFSSDLSVGFTIGSTNVVGNRLIISNGGSVLVSGAGSTLIGNTVAGSNNTVLVTGKGSLLQSPNGINVGNGVGSATLTIGTGGTVTTDLLWISAGGGATGYVNVGTPGGNDTNVTLGASTITFGINYASLSFNQADTLTNSSVINDYSGGGDKIINQAGSGTTVITGNGSSTAANIFVTGGQLVMKDATFTSTGALNVGFVGTYPGTSYNFGPFSNTAPVSMIVASNSSVSFGVQDGGSSIGISSSSNRVIVSGSNATMTNLGFLEIGEKYNRSSAASIGNNLTVSNGGNVYVQQGLIIGGYNGGIFSNSVTIYGNSTLTVGGDTVIGASGYGPSSQNYVTITGSNAVWNNVGDFYAGEGGSSNTLQVSQGGSLINSGTVYVGSGGVGNALSVTGSNTTFSSGNLTVGSGGQSNTASFQDGNFSIGALTLGNQDGDTGNQVIVTGSNTVLTGNGAGSYPGLGASIGNNGSSNTFVISNGATANMTMPLAGTWYNFYVGQEVTASNNTVVVTGTNSAWNMGNANRGSDFYMGYNGAGNSLIISNGGSVTEGLQSAIYGTVVGYASTSSNNSVLVTGSNSLWNNRGYFFFGFDGSGNQMTVSNHATVYADGNDYGVNVGYASDSSNNSILVTAGGLWSVGTQLYMGYDGSSNSLIISGGGTVTVAGDTIIGNNSDSSNNTVLVTGTNSLFTNGQSLIVGGGGSGNQLIVTNGATSAVVSSFIVGNGGSFNTATVTGTNSTLTAGGINVSQGGNNNSLIITNGATVISATTTTVGSGGTGGSILITGSNSVLTNADFISIGNGNGSSTLLVTNGGRLYSGAQSGGDVIGQSSGNNSGTITGNGSLWAVAGDASQNFFVGNSGNSNTLSILSGGTLSISGMNYVEVGSSGALDSLLNVSNATVTVTNTAGLYVGIYGAGQSTLTVGSSTFTASVGDFGVGYNGSSSNTALLSGTGVNIQASNSLSVGANGSSFNNLILTNGAKVSSVTGNVGVNGSYSNSVLITGAGSRWSNSGSITIGNSGSGTVTIGGGGSLISSNISLAVQAGDIGTLNIGTYGGNDTNVTLGVGSVTFNQGTGSVNFNQASTLVVSTVFNGAINSTNFNVIAQLGTGTTIFTGQQTGTNGVTLIANGGALVMSNAIYTSDSHYRYSGRIYVGYQNDADVQRYMGLPAYSNSAPVSMLITSNSTVSASLLEIGYGYLGTNYISSGNASNSLVVNSSILNLNDLYVGDGGNSNGLILTNNATVNVSSEFDIGDYGNGNKAIVTGTNTVLSVGGDFYLGYNYGDFGGLSNSLVISNGAKVLVSDYTTIGYESYTNGNNSVLVTGTNSTFSNQYGIYLGYYEDGDTIIVTNGAKLFGSDDYIGYGYTDGVDYYGGNSNSLIITGSNSIYSNSGILYVGYGDYYQQGASNNLVVISNGATATVDSDVNIGYWGGNSDAVIVTGTNTKLTVGGDLYVGNNDGEAGGTNNRLVIDNAAQVLVSGILYLGNDSVTNANNTVMVSGSNSLLSVTSEIDIGDYESADSMTASNGGKIINAGDTYISYGGGSNNSILITGAGSTFSNGGTIYIGDTSGSGSGSVTIASRGTLISSNITIASQVGSAGILNVGTYGGSDTNITLNAPTISFGSSYAAVNFNQADVLTNTSAFGGNAGFNGCSVIAQLGSGTTILAGNGVGVTNGADIVFVNGGLVIGTNAVYNSTGSLYVGYQGSYGQNGWNSFSNSSSVSMVIKDGAQVSLGQSVDIGSGTSNSNNSLLVTGPGTVVSSYEIYLDGNNNTMTVSNRASVTSADEIDIGDWSGNSNRLIVAGGGTITAMQDDTIGGNGFSGNALIVTGSNSLFTNAQYGITVGYGNSNYITVANGGTLYANGSFGSGITIGANSGDFGNSLVVSNTGQVFVNGDIQIGNQDASNNSILVNGSNSVLTDTGVLFVGNGTSVGSDGNSLIISNGGRVYVGSSLTIGNGYYDSSNSVLISGLGSILAVTNGINFGNNLQQMDNTMTISNGGNVIADNVTIGNYTGLNSGFNTMTVDGTNSVVNITTSMNVGIISSGNTLIITNGGKVYDSNASVSMSPNPTYYNGGSNNTVIVSGIGSLWSNGGTVNIGDGTSPNNSLILNDHALVIAQGGVALSTNSLLTGNGTITAPSFSLDNATFAPTGTSALTLNGNLSFTNSGIYAWNLFNNSSSTNGGTNFTVPVVLNGALSVTTNSVFDLTFGGAINQGNSFWTNSQQWLVTAGTNSLSQGTNFGLSWSSPGASAGFNLADFSLSASNNNFYLNYNAPLITNPIIPAGTNALPSYNTGSNTVLVITAPTNGTAVLSGTNNTALTGIIVNSGTLASTNQNSIPTNASVTVYNGTMGFTGPGTNTIANLFVSGGQVAASNTIVNVQSFVQTGGTLSGGTNATYWSGNYYFAATNDATVNANLANLGTQSNYHSTAVVTTNTTGAPAAPVVFANDMSYDGGTVITGGILQLGSSNSTGAVTVQGAITNNGYLNYGYNGNSTTPTNTVIGSGVIGQVGTGTLTVGTNGIDNAFTGSFSAANGTLALSSNSALGASTNFYLASSGTLQATTGVTNITQSIQVTNGTGTVQNSGTGTLVLSGPVSITGAEIVFKGGNGINVTGSISGSDPVIDGGVTTWSAVNTFNAATYIIDGGTLNAAVANALPTANGRSAVYIDQTNGGTSYGTGSSTLSLGANQSVASLSGASSSLVNLLSHQLTIGTATGSTTYAGVISGTGSLLKDSASTQILTGANTYSGGTTVTNGTLVTVNTSALGSGDVSLGGTGTLQLRSLLTIGAFNWSGGQVAIPTLTSTNGVYLASTNGLTIPGGSHVFNLSGASLTIGTPTRLLGATNMSTNSFSTNEFTVTGVGNYSLLISNDILWIDLLNNPAPSPTAVVYPNFVSYAANRNQVNVATALNSFTNNPNADQTIVLNSLTALTNSPGSMQQAFNAIMPNFYQQMATIAFNSANAQNMELSQRLWGMRVAEGGGFSMNGFGDNTPMIQEGQGDGDGKGVLDAKKDILRPGLDNRWGMFLDANGIFAQANSGNMLPGYQSESGGVTTGLTYKWNKNVSSGIYAGYQGTYNKLGAAGSGLGVGSTLIDNAVRFGFFGTYGQVNSKGEPLGFYANALAGGAYNNYQASRIIQYPGINRTATSQPGAGELDSMIAGGYDLKAGNFTYGPSASLQYTYLGANGVNETGAQSLDYNSSGWNSSSMLSSVGAHGAYTWMVKKLEGHEVAVVPQISLSWQHEFMQNPYAINGNLGGTTPNFSNWSATPIRDFLYTGVGVTVEFAKRWNTSFFYNAAAGNKDLVSQSIFLSAGLKF